MKGQNTVAPCLLCGAPTNMRYAWFNNEGKRTTIIYSLCGAHQKGETTRQMVAAKLGQEA